MCLSHLATMMLQGLLWIVAMTMNCCSTMDPMMQAHASEEWILLEVEVEESEETNVVELMIQAHQVDGLAAKGGHPCAA